MKRYISTWEEGIVKQQYKHKGENKRSKEVVTMMLW